MKCSTCGLYIRVPGVCPICTRRAAVGLLVEVLEKAAGFDRDYACDGADHQAAHTHWLDGLDAIATLLSSYRGELNRARRDLNEEMRQASRDARDSAREAYAQGVSEGRRD